MITDRHTTPKSSLSQHYSECCYQIYLITLSCIRLHFPLLTSVVHHDVIVCLHTYRNTLCNPDYSWWPENKILQWLFSLYSVNVVPSITYKQHYRYLKSVPSLFFDQYSLKHTGEYRFFCHSCTYPYQHTQVILNFHLCITQAIIPTPRTCSLGIVLPPLEKFLEIHTAVSECDGCKILITIL